MENIYYTAHLINPLLKVSSNRRETEIEYLVRLDAERKAAEKEELRRERNARIKAAFRTLLNELRTTKTAYHNTRFGH